MKRVSIFAIVLVIVISFAGCGNRDVKKYDYTFKGENSDWEGVLQYNAMEVFTRKDAKWEYENEDNTEFSVTYKGDLADLSTVKHMEISYETKFSKSTHTADYTDDYPRDKTFKLSGGSRGSHLMKKDEIVKVTIMIDNKTQTFELNAE